MPSITSVLLAAGATADGPPDTEETPLITAASYGETGVARVLVEAGANLEAVGVAVDNATALGHNAQERAQALRAAVVCEQLEIIGQLLNADTDVDALTENLTALQWAGYYGKVRAARHLVERGADPERTDPEHHATALAWARYRHRELSEPSPGHDEVEQYIESLTPGSS